MSPTPRNVQRTSIDIYGKPLVQCDMDGKLKAWLKQCIPRYNQKFADRPNYSPLLMARCPSKMNLPDFNWPTVPDLELNELYIPAGFSRYSIGTFIVPDDADYPDYTSLHITSTYLDSNNQLQTETWTRKLYPIHGTSFDGASEYTRVVMTFVDWRYFLQFVQLERLSYSWEGLVDSIHDTAREHPRLSDNDEFNDAITLLKHNVTSSTFLIGHPDLCYFKVGEPAALVLDHITTSLGIGFQWMLGHGQVLLSPSSTQTLAGSPRKGSLYGPPGAMFPKLINGQVACGLYYTMGGPPYITFSEFAEFVNYSDATPINEAFLQEIYYQVCTNSYGRKSGQTLQKLHDSDTENDLFSFYGNYNVDVVLSLGFDRFSALAVRYNPIHEGFVTHAFVVDEQRTKYCSDDSGCANGLKPNAEYLGHNVRDPILPGKLGWINVETCYGESVSVKGTNISCRVINREVEVKVTVDDCCNVQVEPLCSVCEIVTYVTGKGNVVSYVPPGTYYGYADQAIAKEATGRIVAWSPLCTGDKTWIFDATNWSNCDASDQDNITVFVNDCCERFFTLCKCCDECCTNKSIYFCLNGQTIELKVGEPQTILTTGCDECTNSYFTIELTTLTVAEDCATVDVEIDLTPYCDGVKSVQTLTYTFDCAEPSCETGTTTYGELAFSVGNKSDCGCAQCGCDCTRPDLYMCFNGVEYNLSDWSSHSWSVPEACCENCIGGGTVSLRLVNRVDAEDCSTVTWYVQVIGACNTTEGSPAFLAEPFELMIPLPCDSDECDLTVSVPFKGCNLEFSARNVSGCDACDECFDGGCTDDCVQFSASTNWDARTFNRQFHLFGFPCAPNLSRYTRSGYGTTGSFCEGDTRRLGMLVTATTIAGSQVVLCESPDCTEIEFHFQVTADGADFDITASSHTLSYHTNTSTNKTGSLCVSSPLTSGTDVDVWIDVTVNTWTGSSRRISLYLSLKSRDQFVDSIGFVDTGVSSHWECPMQQGQSVSSDVTNASIDELDADITQTSSVSSTMIPSIGA